MTKIAKFHQQIAELSQQKSPISAVALERSVLNG